MCQMIFLSRKLIHSLIEASLLNPTCIPLVGQKNDLGVPPKPMMISPQNDSHLTWHRCLKRLPLPGWLQITPRMLRTMPWLAIQKKLHFPETKPSPKSTNLPSFSSPWKTLFFSFGLLHSAAIFHIHATIIHSATLAPAAAPTSPMLTSTLLLLSAVSTVKKVVPIHK